MIQTKEERIYRLKARITVLHLRMANDEVDLEEELEELEWKLQELEDDRE